MSFDTEVAKDGRGRVIRVDASLDKFATIAYRWGDKAGDLDGTNTYDNRVLSLSPIRRGLGQSRIATGATTELLLDNADGALDALCGQATIDDQAKMRVRIYVSLYDPTVAPLSFTAKLLGEFILTEWPEQDDATLRMQLGDDVLGPLGQQAALPTLLDWQAVGTTANNPIKTSMGLPASISERTPVQLAFGEDWVPCLPHIIPWESPDADYIDHVIVPICTTADLGAVDQGMVTSLRVRWLAYDDTGGPGSAGQANGEMGVLLRDIPRTRIVDPAYGTGAAVTETNWTVEKSPTITKDGKTFQIVYLVVRCNLGMPIFSNADAGTWDTGPLGEFQLLGGYPVNAVAWAGADYRVTACRVLDWYVKGVPLSAITQRTSAVQHAVDVLTDLVTEYSNNTSVTVDSAAATRVKAGNSEASCSGVIQPWSMAPKKGDTTTSTEPPSLRQSISLICQSSDLDVFINWSGEFSFTADVWDFTLATQGSGLFSIPETALQSGVRGRIPGQGERWAPFNRISVKGGKPNHAEDLPVPFQGPWDLDSGDQAAVALSSRIIEATLEQGWRPYRQMALDPRNWRSLNVKARDLVLFRMHMEGLVLDLGSYFKLTWTRGPSRAGPYSETVFQLESIVYAPADDAVEITAIWRDDTSTERAYLLDDESILEQPDLTLTDTCDPTGGATVDLGPTANIANLIIGGILVLRDTTQAADVFTRNGAWLIINFDPSIGASSLTVAPNGEGNYPAAGSVASGQWTILYGATAYPTDVSHPAQYPSGGDMYGKATNAAGEYSNSDTGNRLLSG